MSRLRDVSSEDFKRIVAESFYMVDVLEKLGYTRTSGTMTKYVKKRIEEENIDISHFRGKSGNRGGGNSQRYTLDEILIENSFYTNRNRLKIRLISNDVLKNECVICGIGNMWNGKPLTLHLDHINGIHNDNRIDNLRILCPNCHSQTDTYSGKNNK